MSEHLQPYVDFAMETAWLAGRLTLGYYLQERLETDLKADRSPVTVADRLAEELIRERIESAFPDHAIVGEEFGGEPLADHTHRWYVDPIDGTRAFTRGVPLYAVLIGLEIDGRAEVGVAYFPVLEEMLAAATGLGCRWNGRPARVSDTRSLADGIVTHANVASFAPHGREDAFRRFTAAAGYCAGWSDAYAYLLIATGRADVALDPVMKAWDCAPFPPILREAGGYFGDWSGTETIHGGEALATTQTLLPAVLELVRGHE